MFVFRIPADNLNAKRLTEAINYAVSEPALEAARKMGEQIRAEVTTVVSSTSACDVANRSVSGRHR